MTPEDAKSEGSRTTGSPSKKKTNKMVNGEADSSHQEENRIRKALTGASQKVSDASKGAVAKVKQVSQHFGEAEDEKPAAASATSDGESSINHQHRSTADGKSLDVKSSQSSEQSKRSKLASATKKTLSKPLSATKNAITSTGKAMNVKKKKSPQKQDSTLSELSTEEKDSNADNTIAETAATGDDSMIKVPNATPAKQVEEEEEKSDIMICMGPVLSFLLHDATIAIGSSLLIAAYPTFVSLEQICQNQIPLSVTLVWIMVAFAVGYEVALFRSIPVTLVEEDIMYEDVTIPSVIDVPISAAAPPKRGYSILHRISVKLPKGLEIQIPQQLKQRHVRSSLVTKRGEQPRWQRRARAPVSKSLMQRLLRNPSYQRRSVEVEEQIETVQVEEGEKDTQMGAYALPDAESLKQDVVEPLFHLRGMDIFLTGELQGGAEENISQHPFLLENGLRDTPSFVVNVMTQWANILIYFELPSWIKNWDNIEEEADDHDDVKALKRFLNGDEEYKDLRLKMLPYVVDGPLPIRMLAPPKRERTVHCDLLPTKWRQSEGMTRPDGRYLHPCLELELDLMANKTMRGFSSLVKRHLCKLSVDVAVVIDKPDLQEEEEPSACVGMWRFDKVDVSQCPHLPERLGHSVQADTIRASILMQQTQLDIQSVRQELDGIPEAQVVAA